MSIVRPNLNGNQLRIGIIQTRFTNEIGSKMLEVCCRALKKLGVIDENITAATIPGALEVLLVLQSMAANNQYDALIAIDVVIRGGTYHSKLISSESGAGVTRAGLDHDIPITNAILATGNNDQTVVHIEEKVPNAAKVAVEYANLINLLLEERFNGEGE